MNENGSHSGTLKYPRSGDTHDEHYSEESQSKRTTELPESTIKNPVIKKLLKGIFLCYVVIWNQKETSKTYCLNTTRTVVGHKLIFLFISSLSFSFLIEKGT